MHKFSPDKAKKLERPERYRLLPPGETLVRFGARKGMTIVDVGAGTGFFARAAAKIVGHRGKVIAADISEEMLGFMQESGLPENVQPVRSQEYSIPVPDAEADMVLAAFVVHEADDRARFLRELMRLLKPGGRLLIIEWKKQDEEHGPPEGERLDEQDLDASLASFRAVDKGSLNESHYYRVLE
ncbi:MAG: methyltransferase domain-containing protein [Bacteroidetes bacterium]|nr:methyltransferase domain-containing protein [Bacteroidota bacterium]